MSIEVRFRVSAQLARLMRRRSDLVPMIVTEAREIVASTGRRASMQEITERLSARGQGFDHNLRAELTRYVQFKYPDLIVAFDTHATKRERGNQGSLL